MKTVVLVVNNREVTAIIPEKTDVVNRTQILTYTVWYENGDSLGDLAHTSGVGSDRNTRQSGLSESCQESWQHDHAELTGVAGLGRVDFEIRDQVDPERDGPAVETEVTEPSPR